MGLHGANTGICPAYLSLSALRLWGCAFIAVATRCVHYEHTQDSQHLQHTHTHTHAHAHTKIMHIVSGGYCESPGSRNSFATNVCE